MLSSSGNLAGKVAVVTGASKGIGAAIAKELAARGASVVVNYSSSKADADKVVAAIAAKGGKAVAIGANIADPAQIERFFAETKRVHDKVDILVNNAGIFTFEPLEAVTAKGIGALFDVNVTGTLLVSQAAVALMPASGGAIVNIGSIVAEGGAPNAAAYAGTKGTLNTITRGLAKELGARKIRVNSVNPGMTMTEGWTAAGIEGSDFHKQVLATTPLGRLGTPEDIALVVAFLVSDDARWITGSLVDAAGGWR